MLELAAPRPGERALDVATGTGLVLWELAEAVGPSGVAIGIDFTPAMLSEAVRRQSGATGGLSSGSGALVAAHAAYLPCRPSTFDIVTCRFSVHHFADPAASLQAMAAALGPGGRLVIADFVRPADANQALLHDRLERLRGHHHVQIYERARLEAMLAAADCPVAAARTIEREARGEDWLNSPNVAPENRTELAELVHALGRAGGGGFEVRRVGADVRFLRSDVVLLGIRRR